MHQAYQTLSTKDVDVSARRKMFDKENYGDSKQSNSNSAKKNRLLDQLRSATKERDRLLLEYAELTEAKTMPLESLHPMEVQFQDELQGELTQQKIMILEMQIQQNVEENRKFESELAEIKRSRETRKVDLQPNVQTQFRRINEDLHQQIADLGALDTANDENKEGQNTKNIIEGEMDSLQQMIEDSRNTEAMKNYSRNKNNESSDNYDSLMSMIQHQENKDAMGKTFYKKHLHGDVSLWDVKEEMERTDVFTTNEKQEKITKTNDEKVQENKDIVSSKVDSLQEMIDNSKNTEAVQDYSRNKQPGKPEGYDSLMSMVEHIENKEAMGKTLYQKHLQGDVSLGELQEETDISETREDRKKKKGREKTSGENLVRKDTLYGLVHSEANVAAMVEENDEEEFPQDKYQPDTLQKILKSEPNVTALEKGNTTRSRKQRDFTKSRYDTLESLIYKPENQAAIEQEQETDETDSTPMDLLKRLESEITVIMKKDAKEQKENDNWTTTLELISRLESQMKDVSERESNQTSDFELELKRQQDKYTELEKKYHKKKDELMHVKTELHDLKQQNHELLSKLQNH